MAEIDDRELADLRRLQQITSVIMRNPTAAQQLESAWKVADPDNAKTPITDQENARRAPIDAMQKQIDDLKAEREKEKTEYHKRENLTQLSRQIDDGKIKLKQAGWTEDGLKKLDTLMEERGLVDVEAAAALYERLNPPPPIGQPGSTGASWNLTDPGNDDELKALLDSRGNSEMAINKLVASALSEVRARR